MGKFSRDKGKRLERWIVNFLKECGYQAERVPLSGSMRGSFGGDVRWTLGERLMQLECKSRAEGFKFLYDGLTNNDALICKADRLEPLVVMKLDDLICLIDSPFKAKPSSFAAAKGFSGAINSLGCGSLEESSSPLTSSETLSTGLICPTHTEQEQSPNKSARSKD